MLLAYGGSWIYGIMGKATGVPPKCLSRTAPVLTSPKRFFRPGDAAIAECPSAEELRQDKQESSWSDTTMAFPAHHHPTRQGLGIRQPRLAASRVSPEAMPRPPECLKGLLQGLLLHEVLPDQ